MHLVDFSTLRHINTIPVIFLLWVPKLSIPTVLYKYRHFLSGLSIFGFSRLLVVVVVVVLTQASVLLFNVHRVKSFATCGLCRL